MKRKNIKRNALVTSILSLLLCVSMLVGTTFAWFTDEVVSGRNTIAAGNLDIELLANGNKVNESTVLFDNKQLWEPGVVVYENLQIANEGTLALKYQLTLDAIKENDLNGHKLSEVVKIALVDKIEQGATRAEVLAAAKASEKVGTLADFFISGALEAGAKTEEAAVVVFWEPGENDNWYNANNGQKTSDEQPLFIEFGVKLFATQQMHEEDSFGSDYDKLVWANALQVRTVQDLMDAIAAGETTVMLMGNLNLEAPLEITEGTELALNLNGKKISGATDKNTGALLVNKGKLTLVGGTVENTAVTGAAAIENQGELTLSGTQVVGAPMGDSSYPEYAIRTTGKLAVEPGTKVTSDRGAIRTDAGAEVVINGGEFIISDKADGRNMTIHTVYAYGSGSSVTINGGRFEQNHSSTGGASVICPAGAAVTVNGGTFYDPMGDESWQNTANFQNYMGYSAPVVVKGGTFSDMTFKKWMADGYSFNDVDGNHIVVKGVVVDSAADLQAAIDAGEKNINLAAGTYVIPANSDVAFSGFGKETVIDINGAIKNVNISNATITGATEIKVLSGESAVFENVVFDAKLGGASGGQYGSVSGTATFKGCTFERLLHFDTTNNATIVIEDCTFGVLGSIKMGKGAQNIIVKDTTFVDTTSTSIWGEKGITFYCPVTFTNCEFNNRNVVVSPAGQSVTFNSCTMNGGQPVYYVNNEDGIIRGGNVPNVTIN